MWEEIWNGIAKEFSDLPSAETTTRLSVRMFLACVLGGLVGWNRELNRKAAGLRTHMLVCLGTAFVIAIPQQAGMLIEDLSRVIQGIMAGIGFIGAGTILKQEHKAKVEGLTSAASVWFVACMGVAIGLGREASSILATLFVLAILVVTPRVRDQ